MREEGRSDESDKHRRACNRIQWRARYDYIPGNNYWCVIPCHRAYVKPQSFFFILYYIWRKNILSQFKKKSFKLKFAHCFLINFMYTKGKSTFELSCTLQICLWESASMNFWCPYKEIFLIYEFHVKPHKLKPRKYFHPRKKFAIRCVKKVLVRSFKIF